VLALAAVKKGIAFAKLLHATHNVRRLRPALWPPATWITFGKVMVDAYFVAHPNPSLEHAKDMVKDWRRIQTDIDVFFASSGEIPEAVPLDLLRAHAYFPPTGHNHIVDPY